MWLEVKLRALAPEQDLREHRGCVVIEERAVAATIVAKPTWEEAFAQAKQDVFGAVSRVGAEPHYAPGTALSDYWVLHIAEMGPACGPEREGFGMDPTTGQDVVVAVFQGFSTGVYKWVPGGSVEKAA